MNYKYMTSENILYIKELILKMKVLLVKCTISGFTVTEGWLLAQTKTNEFPLNSLLLNEQNTQHFTRTSIRSKPH